MIELQTGKLKGARIYLSGPIEKAKDSGTNWRREFVQKADHLGLKIIDPTDKPKPFASEVGVERETIIRLRKEKRYEELKDFMTKKVRRPDLRFCDIADFLIVYIDTKIYTTGTWDEVFTAERQKKPLLCIIEGGLANLPDWAFAVFELSEVFGSVDECVEYLTKLDNGEAEMDNRWVLIGQSLENNEPH